MGLHSEEEMTSTYQTTRHPIAIHIATLAILTAHRADTATATPSPINIPGRNIQLHTRRSRNETT